MGFDEQMAAAPNEPVEEEAVKKTAWVDGTTVYALGKTALRLDKVVGHILKKVDPFVANVGGSNDVEIIRPDPKPEMSSIKVYRASDDTKVYTNFTMTATPRTDDTEGVISTLHITWPAQKPKPDPADPIYNPEGVFNETAWQADMDAWTPYTDRPEEDEEVKLEYKTYAKLTGAALTEDKQSVTIADVEETIVTGDLVIKFFIGDKKVLQK